jgi:hypothetical protein
MLRTEGYDVERARIIRFILHYRKQILQDPLAPKRDKIAIALLSVDYKLYRAFWMTYQNALFKKK